MDLPSSSRPTLQGLDSPEPSGPTPAAESGRQAGAAAEAGQDVLAGLKQDDKAHWKLRALANIRRHSDSEIFISHAQKRYCVPRPSCAYLAEKLSKMEAKKGLEASKLKIKKCR